MIWNFRAERGLVISKFPNGKQGRMVDALASKGDEGRSLAAIRFGEVPSNLWSGDVRMRKRSASNRITCLDFWEKKADFNRSASGDIYF